jgi:TonB family protein
VRHLTISLIALFAASAGGAGAQTPPEPAIDATPAAPGASAPSSQWASRPSIEQLRKVAPADGARAVVRCHVNTVGNLSGCETLNETPAASGFAAAVAELAPLYRLKPDSMKAMARNGVITMSVDTFSHDTPPNWIRKPTARDLYGVWPPAAQRTGMGGWAVVSCLANAKGVLLDCIPLDEFPAGAGFGAAAVALTPQFLMKPAMLKGQPVASVINIPINFQRSSVNYNRPVPATTLSPAMAWLEAPTYTDVVAAYPKKAQAARVTGRASIACGFDQSGHLVGCRTIAEEPKGEGFADAAHALARRFRADAKTPDGRAISRAEIEVPFFFDPAALSDAKPLIGKPKWQSLPTSTETDVAFGEILKAGVGTVRVSLSCKVQQGGALSDCSVASEDPEGKGVGQAALTLTPQFKVSTWTMEGLPTVGGTIKVPLRLEGQGDVPAAAKP